MSLLNTENDGNYPELIVLSRLASQKNNFKEQELIDTCAPVIVKDTKFLRNTLLRWSQMGHFVRNSDQSIKIASVLSDLNEVELLDALPKNCLRLVLDPRKALPLWDENQGVSADFVRGITWLLIQDIFNFQNGWEEVQKLESLQLKEGFRVLQNNTRWAPLQRWGAYLGLVAVSGQMPQIDPTKAIQWALPSVFGSEKELSASAFVATLAEEIPVLDGGRYRLELERAFREEYFPKPQPGHLSISLSYALKRLGFMRLINLETRADAEDSLVLSRHNGQSGQRFTHVRWTGIEA
jgi:hypothetical protein